MLFIFHFLSFIFSISTSPIKEMNGSGNDKENGQEVEEKVEMQENEWYLSSIL